MAKKTSTRNRSTLTGTKAADTLTVKHTQVTVKAGAGKDRINVNSGSSHKIYGEASNDTIIIAAKAGSGSKIYGDDASNKLTGNDMFTISGGKKNYFYGGKGVDTFNVNGGTTNYIYGGAGNDVIVIGKTSTGTAVVKDFSVKSGNKDTVKVSGGAVKSIAVSGSNMIVKGGKSASVTLQNAKAKTFTVTDTLGNYTVAGSNIKLKLGKTYKGTLNAASFLTTVDARSNANTVTINGNAKNNTIYGGAGNNTLNGGAGNDTIIVSAGSKVTVNGGSGVDTIRINGGSGHVIQSGSGNDKVYINGGSLKSIANSGGNDYIEIGKNTVNGIKINWGNNGNYKLIANETVKVLGGSNHDIRLYGGNDKVIVAGGSGHVIYTDGPTGSGDAGGNDTIVIQSGGRAKKIVAGDGNDVIAIANGAGNGSTIYTGVENPSNVNTGKGTNTVNVLGGTGHTLYLGGTGNKVLIEAQNVTLNKYAGTSDDIRVRWSEQGTGTLRINCPSVSSSKKSTLRLEGVNSWQFEFYKEYVDIKNANGVVSETVDALVMKFVGNYERDTRTVSGSYQWDGDNGGNTRLPVYVNGNGTVQYNWCSGNQQTSYNATPVATGGSIEITRWNTASLRVFDTIEFDDRSVGYNDIITATGRDTHSLYNG